MGVMSFKSEDLKLDIARARNKKLDGLDIS